jgi:class 3 adenylate cyclase/pimeloyl-ACP methyl ester carboxylesterase
VPDLGDGDPACGDRVNDSPETEYVKTSDGVYIAYQAVGEGPTDVVIDFHPDESNVDLMWAEPDWQPFLTGTTAFGRVIVHDRRGLGVSSRNVPAANLETRVSDLLTVLDTVGSARPILFAGSDTGAMHALFAATHPDRVTALLWNNPVARTAWAPDYPWGQGQEEFERLMRLSDAWGTVEYSRELAEFRAAERIGRASKVRSTGIDRPPLSDYGRINRNTATPDVAREIARITWDTDVRAILPSVHAPVALVTGTQDRVGEVAYIASLMPNATVHTVEGRSGLAYEPILEILRRMAGADPPAPELETVLATVLFTDIVESTKVQAALGDRGWRDLVQHHHAIVREALRRWRGTENDTAGDGFYATFDGPARAIRCALQIVEGVRDLDLEIRAGVHTGECELLDGKCTGIAVSIGARVASKAGPSQVLVSQTVRDLVAGSGFTFADAGEHDLKGVPGRWRLYGTNQAAATPATTV